MQLFVQNEKAISNMLVKSNCEYRPPKKGKERENKIKQKETTEAQKQSPGRKEAKEGRFLQQARGNFFRGFTGKVMDNPWDGGGGPGPVLTGKHLSSAEWG